MSDYNGNEEVLALSPRLLCEFIAAALADKDDDLNKNFLLRNYTNLLLARRLPFTQDEIIILLKKKGSSVYGSGAGRVFKAVENFLEENPFTEELRKQIELTVESIEKNYHTAEAQKWALKFRKLLGGETFKNPIVAGEAWADEAIANLSVMEDERRNLWLELLNFCQTSDGASPSGKWTKSAFGLLEKIGFDEFKSHVLRWFPLVDKPRTERIAEWSRWIPAKITDPTIVRQIK